MGILRYVKSIIALFPWLDNEKSHKKAPASKKAVSKQAKETKNTEYKNLFTK